MAQHDQPAAERQSPWALCRHRSGTLGGPLTGRLPRSPGGTSRPGSSGTSGPVARPSTPRSIRKAPREMRKPASSPAFRFLPRAPMRYADAPARKTKIGVAEVRDPAAEVERDRGRGRVQRVDRHVLKEVAGVVQGHDENHQPAEASTDVNRPPAAVIGVSGSSTRSPFPNSGAISLTWPSGGRLAGSPCRYRPCGRESMLRHSWPWHFREPREAARRSPRRVFALPTVAFLLAFRLALALGLAADLVSGAGSRVIEVFGHVPGHCISQFELSHSRHGNGLLDSSARFAAPIISI